MAIDDTQDLFTSCFTQQECETLGIDNYQRISLRHLEDWEQGKLFQLSIQPLLATREGMSLTNLQFWYQDQPDTVWYPTSDFWDPLVSTKTPPQ